MDIRLEAGEGSIEFTGKLQIATDCLVKPFPRNKQGNTRRVRRQQDCRYTAFKLVDRDTLDFPVRHLGKGIGRTHRRHHVRKIHFGR